MNILILSCGTRNILVRYFKDKNNGFDKVVGTDCSTYAPALYETDSYYIVPRMTEPGYLDVILDICRKEEIDTVLPLQEDELYLIAENRTLFTEAGVTPIVSSKEAVELCRDKYEFYKHLTANDIPAIYSVDSFEAFEKAETEGKMQLPVFIKPSRGCGSLGIMKVEQKPLLECLCKYADEKYIIQNYAKGEEFGADIYVDVQTGKPVTLFVKKKLRMRAGETDKSVSFRDEKLFELILETVSTLDLRGPIDMDLFCIDGNYYVSEINPRFGGGYPHAYECGINFPALLAANISGPLAEEKYAGMAKYEENRYMFKYTDFITKDFV